MTNQLRCLRSHKWLGQETGHSSRESRDEPTTGNPTTPAHPARPSADTPRNAQVSISTERSTHTPEFFRTVASLGIHAAEALDHAHSHGIVHRDIKPGNLMLDEEGHLWITDFGLARIEADPGLTMTGDILGTLRYMSPEQALAKRVVVDHRADIYSLGVTLYELLTLEPAVHGDDREEVLKEIAFVEPRQPRRVNKSIPVDLETVILKAMRKNPEERYDTAQEFADDLTRFTEDKLIRARRPTLRQRAVKWSRRHRSIVASLFCILFIATICLGASLIGITGALARTKQAQQAAVHERNMARNERDTALYNIYVAHMRLAQHEWEEGHIASVLETLDKHVPADGQSDLRGWEWYYLKSLCHKDLATLVGHTAAVNRVAWSLDGGRLASASDDGTVKVWDTATTRESITLRGHEGEVTSLAWSPDGSRLALGSRDNTIRIWDVTNNVVALTIQVDDQLTSLTWSPDGKQLAGGNVGEKGGMARVWDASSGAEISRLATPPDIGSPESWSPDGGRLAFVGNYGNSNITIWDVRANKQIHQILHVHSSGIFVVAWSPDGKYLATGGRDQQIMIWDTANWQEVRTIHAHAGNVNSVAWNDAGDMLASGGDDGKVNLWNWRTGEQIRTFRGHTAPVHRVAWRGDGQRLASGSADGTVKIWDPQQIQAYLRPNAGQAVALSPDGTQFAATGEAWEMKADRQPALTIFDVHSGKEISAIPIPRESPEEGFYMGALAWSPEGKRLAAGFDNGTLKGTVKVLEIDTQKELLHIDAHPDTEVRSAAWSPDGITLVTAGTDGLIKVFNAATGKETRVLTCRRNWAGSVAFSPDGRQLASSGKDVAIWDTLTWQEVRHWDLHPGLPSWGAIGQYGVAWSPRGDRLVAGSNLGWMIVWDTATGREVLSIHGHVSNIRSIAWSPDGRRIATGGEDQNIKIWDADTGACMVVLKGHTHGWGALIWSPDGKRLLSRAGVVYIWDASKGYDVAARQAATAHALERPTSGLDTIAAQDAKTNQASGRVAATEP